MKDSLSLKDLEKMIKIFKVNEGRNNAYEEIIIGLYVITNQSLKRTIDLFNCSKYHKTKENNYSTIFDILNLGQKYLKCNLEMDCESIYITIYDFFKFDVISYILKVRDESLIEENKTLLSKLLDKEFDPKGNIRDKTMNEILSGCMLNGKETNYLQVPY